MNINERILKYPCGCLPIDSSLGRFELLKRLELLNYKLRNAADGSDQSQDYKPLALHLINDTFITHPNKEIQSLVAECISNLLRVSTPLFPYEDHPEQHKIFLFLIDQLSNLADPQSRSQDRYQAILSGLIHVNAFILCLPLEKSEEIFTKLFASMFQILEKNEAEAVKKLAITLMTSLLEQSEEICNQVLGIVLENLMKKSNEEMVKEMLKSLGTTLSYIETNFVDILSKNSNSHLVDEVFSIASQLVSIYPNLIKTIFLQLTKLLNSKDTDKRAIGVAILSNLLSAKRSGLHESVHLDAFFRRFMDKSTRIRILCVKKCKDFLINQPGRRDAVTKRLQLMQKDECEEVRYEVVKTIMSSAQEDLRIFVKQPDLFTCLEERSLDTSHKIRRSILRGLATLYLEQIDKELPEELQSVLIKFINRILSSYYLQDEDDKYYIEKIVNTRIVDYRLDTDTRIHELCELYMAIDGNARDAFIEMQIHQQAFREVFSELLKQLEKENHKMVENAIKVLSKFFPKPEKAEVNLHKFCDKLGHADFQLLEDMKSLINPEASCRVYLSVIENILLKIGDPDDNSYYNTTVRILLSRSSSVLIDREEIVAIIDGIAQPLMDSDEEDSESDVIKGLHLLEILSFMFPLYFSHDEIIEMLLELLNVTNSKVTTMILTIINHIGKYVLDNPAAVTIDLNTLRITLEPICKAFATCGTLKQAKQAIKAIYFFLPLKSNEIFTEFLSNMEESLDPSSPDFQTAIATIGYIATYSSHDFRRIKKLMEKLTIEVVVAHFAEPIRDPPKFWCRRDQLPSRTICKLLAMKSVTRCLLSINAPDTAKQIIKMFDLFIKSEGDIHRGKDDITPQEKSWLRLQAGACLLKLRKFRRFDDKMTSAQFYNLSRLLLDDVQEIRVIFAGKLEKGLRAECPGECLPMDFMGFYALGELEEKEEVKAQLRKHFMRLIKKKKKGFIENPLMREEEEGAEVWSNLLPECVLVYALPVLAHIREFDEPKDVQQLMMIKKCLEFILQPFLDNTILEEEEIVGYYSFFNRLIEKLRHYRDSQVPGDDLLQLKYSAVCDLAKLVIDGKTSRRVKTLAAGESPTFDPYVPKKYLQLDESMDVSEYSLDADIRENISKLEVKEKRKISAARSADKQMMNRTFRLKTQPRGKRNIGKNLAAAGETAEKKKRGAGRNTK